MVKRSRITPIVWLDATAQGVWRRTRFIPLPRVACDVLRCLEDHAGQIVPLACLCALGPYTTSAVYHSIGLLRGVLERDPKRPQYLLTHRGQGYVLMPYHVRTTRSDW